MLDANPKFAGVSRPSHDNMRCIPRRRFIILALDRNSYLGRYFCSPPLCTKATAQSHSTHSAMLLRSLSFSIALCLLLPALAQGQHDLVVPTDLDCPRGSAPSFVHNNYAFLAPAHEFIHITQSFFNLSWYGANATVVTGKNNVPGATRSGSFAGASFNETLLSYRKDTTSPSPSFLEYTYRGQPGPFVNPTQPWFSVQAQGYIETFRFTGICAKRATLVEVTTHVCSSNQVLAYNYVTQFHDAVLPALGAGLRAPILSGDCPSK
ncbi:unnamed protein product [Mycena citricolor]|uniref:Uncharacterized protein n=1 Tax=Mycena citricolor TaxID=2018698 RepID=A0AAD2H381_9AGAR|nr:unnamed protein product [Mycena citricolor]